MTDLSRGPLLPLRVVSRPLRILLGCETSGVVRRAMKRRGHYVRSYDLLPSEDDSPDHVIGDVREAFREEWDLAIFHPPCTRLCRAGQRWLFGPGGTHPKKLPKGRTWDDMLAEYGEGLELFRACWRAPVKRKAVENPRMHKWAALDLLGDVPAPQIVHPWWFGDPAFKATGLYLDGLPPLTPSDPLTPPKPGTQEYRDWSAIHRASPGPDRWKIRSRTFDGIAEAMADQWAGWVS